MCIETIRDETLWACTMCQACVQECPVLIGHVDLISDMRRDLIGEGKLSGPPAKALQQIGNQSNPYGRPNSERLAWAEGLDVPTVESNPTSNICFWVGCAASFDPRAQKVARATAAVAQGSRSEFRRARQRKRLAPAIPRVESAMSSFSKSARRPMSRRLRRRKVKKIVTPCPHCYNTLKNEYPQFGGQYEVQHHSHAAGRIDRGGTVEQWHADRRADYLARPVLPGARQWGG